MTNQELLELLQSVEMDLYDFDSFGEPIVPRGKVTEAIEEINKRIARADRLRATA